MLLVGLTGGIGSGKSTVARMLAARGAVVIDADDLARRAVEPGTPGYARVVRAFGQDAVSATGELDRRRLAEHVFSDPEARLRLEAIVHPEVARLFTEAVRAYRETERVIVYAVPLLVERGLEATFDVVVTISAAEDVRARRVGRDRGMSERDARARIAAQISDADREAVADVVVRNDGSLADLEERVASLWADLSARAARVGRGGV